MGAGGAALALAAPAVFNGVQARLEQQARGWWPWAPGTGYGNGFWPRRCSRDGGVGERQRLFGYGHRQDGGGHQRPLR